MTGSPQLVLVGGLWTGPEVWQKVDVAPAVVVDLPIAASTTLADQVDAVLAVVDGHDGPSVVVGHSAASTLAWLAADARPDKVSRVVMIGGFPDPDGAKYADPFEIVDGFMAFPGWAAFEGPDAADLSPADRSGLALETRPVPEGVARGIVRLHDERRYQVPLTMICPEFTPDQAREWMAAGDLPELARVEHIEWIDLDSGHWPMVSQPAELASLLRAYIG